MVPFLVNCDRLCVVSFIFFAGFVCWFAWAWWFGFVCVYLFCFFLQEPFFKKPSDDPQMIIRNLKVSAQPSPVDPGRVGRFKVRFQVFPGVYF